MIGWYDPAQLAHTAVEVLISTIFGRHADARVLEALTSIEAKSHDYTKTESGQPRDEMWIDYVADTGDGFDATYAVAYHVSRPTLDLQTPDGAGQRTERGAVLVLGGDEVYPTASRAEYERRLVEPWAMALRNSESPHPHVFAIPGNHDWYDSLVAFLRLFCGRRWFAGWQTCQSRSYFALKLPHRWWLLGTDVQLASDIDEPQINFFRRVAADMSDGDQVIICNAEPDWVFTGAYHQFDPASFTDNNLAYLENRILKGRRVAVFIAGDLHHYRRHEGEGDQTQKITCGGGGAFLHPTHAPEASRLVERVSASGAPGQAFVARASFPDAATSSRLAWRNLYFPFLNPQFGFVPAALYLLTAWALRPDIGGLGFSQVWQALAVTAWSAFHNQMAGFWVMAILGGFLLFTDTHSPRYRIIAGLLHGGSHLLAVFCLTWLGLYLTISVLGWKPLTVSQVAVTGLVIVVGGYFLGGFIMGAYLLVSVNGFGRHYNEAFSSLRIADWKSFLRLHIDRHGDLTIYPVGLRRVPRRWKRPSLVEGGAEVVPDDPAATRPESIEPPVRVRGVPR
jgi:hypothetical protein